MPRRISAIVPVIDEEHALPRLLAALLPEVDEVVVADGGSRDGTVAVARAAGALVVEGVRGRGPQMNAGARASHGDRLWFLHADTRVPAGAGDALRGAAETWGCFETRIGSPRRRLALCARWMTGRARWTGSCTGDMGLWMDRGLFEELAGFPSWPAFEDLALSDAARRRAPWRVLQPPLVTSARRWEVEGLNRTIVRMWALRAGYRAGLDPTWLARSYRSRPRKES